MLRSDTHASALEYRPGAAHAYIQGTLYIFPYITLVLQVLLTHAVILCGPEGLAALLTHIQQATFTNNTHSSASGDTGTWRALHSYSN